MLHGDVGVQLNPEPATPGVPVSRALIVAQDGTPGDSFALDREWPTSQSVPVASDGLEFLAVLRGTGQFLEADGAPLRLGRRVALGETLSFDAMTVAWNGSSYAVVWGFRPLILGSFRAKPLAFLALVHVGSDGAVEPLRTHSISNLDTVRRCWQQMLLRRS